MQVICCCSVHSLHFSPLPAHPYDVQIPYVHFMIRQHLQIARRTTERSTQRTAWPASGRSSHP
jgi:hypothetical protein